MGLLVQTVHFTLLPALFFFLFRLISHPPESHWFPILYAMKINEFEVMLVEILCSVQNEFLGSP